MGDNSAEERGGERRGGEGRGGETFWAQPDAVSPTWVTV